MARQETFYVEQLPPPTRKPPLVETGTLGWMRENLFKNWWNTLLTIAATLFVVWAAVGFLGWAVREANWAVITNNLHLFAVGTYPQQQAWRPLVATLLVMVLLGLSWRLWGRASRWMPVLAALGLAVLYAIPPLTATLPFPDTYFLIGGPATDPLPALAYIAEEGERVTFALQPIPDFREPPPTGFMDRNSLTVYGLGQQEAAARALAVARAIEAGEQPPEVPQGAVLDYQEDQFVVRQRDLAATVTILQVPTEAAQDGNPQETPPAQGQPQELAVLSAGPGLESAAQEVAFPQAGWVLVVPEPEGEFGGFWLRISAIGPLSSSSVEIEARQARFGPPPSLEGQRVQVLDTTYLPFRGQASLADFSKLYLGPLARGLNDFTLALVLATAAGYAAGTLLRGQRWAQRAALAAWIISPFAIFLLLRGLGASPAVPLVDLERWGGVLLTMALTVVGIVAAFPIGVLLALGRRSELPVVRVFCTLSIELVRGVPLVTILFAASLLVPLADPSLSGVDNVVRAMVGIVFFSAAYLAEIVRGGLQAVPYGQTEAAKALGMSGWQITGLIVLPQALRTVIPAIMGQFVSLFKDTSLVTIIGLIDLLGIARSVINQAQYIGLQRETLVFISVIYFVLSYLMSWSSRRLEQTGSGAVRRA